MSEVDGTFHISKEDLRKKSSIEENLHLRNESALSLDLNDFLPLDLDKYKISEL